MTRTGCERTRSELPDPLMDLIVDRDRRLVTREMPCFDSASLAR